MVTENQNNAAGCRFMRRMLEKTHDESGELRVNFVQNIIEFEDRFLSPSDKNFLIRILKSLARGNLVQVKKVAPPSAQIPQQSAGKKAHGGKAEDKLNP